MFKKLFALLVIGATLGAALPTADDGPTETAPLEERDLVSAHAEAAALVERVAFEARASNETAETFVCGSHPPEKEYKSADAEVAKQKTVTNDSQNKTATFTVRVWFHVIRVGGAGSLGDVPYSQLLAQINVLNYWYSGTGLRFVLAGGERTTWAPWFNLASPGTPQQTQMKQQRRLGGVQDLNVYTVGFTPPSVSNLLGYATFPWSYNGNPKDDGVVIRFSTTPGGNNYYNSGKNLVHEVGHWVGLLHTFEGGCNGGDGVADTPAEAVPNYYCPTFLDTCTAAGLDPIHNFMDYSYEWCKYQFTRGQILRLWAYLRYYRGIYLP